MVSISSIKSQLSGLSKAQLIGIAAGTAVVGTGVALGAVAIAKRRKKNSKRKSANRSKNTKRRNNHKKRGGKRGRYTPRTAGKRPDTSRRRIRYTKNGQPYVIVYKNIKGKRRKMARFISKKSARSSQRRSGGRY
jgi:hypothetical protein